MQKREPGGSELLHHEDIEPGKPLALGAKRITRDEIVAFAGKYDPQAIHLDEEAARRSIVGGLCASGFHTCAIMMRLLCDGFLRRVASLGSPGMDEVRWLKPVRPDMLLHARFKALEKRVMASRPEVGISKALVELHSDDGELLATWMTNQLMRVREPSDAPRASTGSRPPALVSLWDEADASASPYADLYFEDRSIGETADIGSHTFTREEIIEFASEFDPQPFHMDEKAAAASLFGGLSASGWQTACYFIRSIVLKRHATNAEIAARGGSIAHYGPSPGFRDLRWIKPVLVGDTVEYRARLAKKIDLRSRPDRGLLATDVQGRNQRGEIVFAITSQVLAERRHPLRA